MGSVRVSADRQPMYFDIKRPPEIFDEGDRIHIGPGPTGNYATMSRAVALQIEMSFRRLRERLEACPGNVEEFPRRKKRKH
jgi:hypothetical protein